MASSKQQFDQTSQNTLLPNLQNGINNANGSNGIRSSTSNGVTRPVKGGVGTSTAPLNHRKENDVPTVVNGKSKTTTPRITNGIASDKKVEAASTSPVAPSSVPTGSKPRPTPPPPPVPASIQQILSGTSAEMEKRRAAEAEVLLSRKRQRTDEDRAVQQATRQRCARTQLMLRRAFILTDTCLVYFLLGCLH